MWNPARSRPHLRDLRQGCWPRARRSRTATRSKASASSIPTRNPQHHHRQSRPDQRRHRRQAGGSRLVARKRAGRPTSKAARTHSGHRRRSCSRAHIARRKTGILPDALRSAADRGARRARPTRLATRLRERATGDRSRKSTLAAGKGPMSALTEQPDASAAGARAPAIRVDHVTVVFGGVRALDDVVFEVGVRRNPLSRRRERQRQEHADQGHHRRLPAGAGRQDGVFRRGRDVDHADRGARPRHRSHLAGFGAVPGNDGRRKHRASKAWPAIGCVSCAISPFARRRRRRLKGWESGSTSAPGSNPCRSPNDS